MIRLAVAGFLIAHGVIHLAVYDTPTSERAPAPFDPARSWALAAGGISRPTMRAASEALGVLVTVVFAIAGVLVLADSESWRGVAGLAAATGLVLKALWFNPWLSLGVALDASVLVAVLAEWPASL